MRARYGRIPDEVLPDMVTVHPADLMGMPRIGRLAAGALADVLVIPGTA